MESENNLANLLSSVNIWSVISGGFILDCRRPEFRPITVLLSSPETPHFQRSVDRLLVHRDVQLENQYLYRLRAALNVQIQNKDEH